MSQEEPNPKIRHLKIVKSDQTESLPNMEWRNEIAPPSTSRSCFRGQVYDVQNWETGISVKILMTGEIHPTEVTWSNPKMAQLWLEEEHPLYEQMESLNDVFSIPAEAIIPTGKHWFDQRLKSPWVLHEVQGFEPLGVERLTDALPAFIEPAIGEHPDPPKRKSSFPRKRASRADSPISRPKSKPHPQYQAKAAQPEKQVEPWWRLLWKWLF